LRFVPLRRLVDAGQPLTPEVTSLRVRASSAFRTLSRPFSARHLPALFRAGPAHGVLPFRVRSPPAEQDLPLGGPCPLVVRQSPGSSTPAPERSAHLKQVPVTSGNLRGAALRATGSTSGPRSLQASASSAGLFKTDRGPRPSWASSSLGGSLSPPAAFQEPILSWVWPAGRKLDRWLPFRVLPVERSAQLLRACRPFRGSVTSSPFLG
jgi:hypothetical protein